MSYYEKVSSLLKRCCIVFLITVLAFSGLAFAAPSAQADTVKTVTIASGTICDPMYIRDSGKPGPVVMIVGGVHIMNRPDTQPPHRLKTGTSKGKLIVLPRPIRRPWSGVPYLQW